MVDVVVDEEKDATSMLVSILSVGRISRDSWVSQMAAASILLA